MSGPARCDWCGGPVEDPAPCDVCSRDLCDSCLEDAVAEMERQSLPEEVSCAFCVGVLPDLPALVDFVGGELRASPGELADLWRESRRQEG